MMEITVAEIIDALTELARAQRVLNKTCRALQHADDVLLRIDALGKDALDNAAYVVTADFWQLLPAQPTRAMTDAFWNRADCPPNHWTFADSYRAMLHAAPPAPGQHLSIVKSAGEPIGVVKHG